MSERAWSTAIAIIAASFLQVVVAPHLSILGVVPSFPLLVVVTLAFVHGANAGAVCGFICGLVLDLLGTNPVGTWALVLTIVGYTAGSLTANVFAEGWLLPATVAAVAGLAAEFAYLLVAVVLGQEVSFWRALIAIVVPRGVYNAVLVLIVYPGLGRFLRTDRPIRSFRRLA